MSDNGFEYANLKLVRGSRGGLFLTYFLPHEAPSELKLVPNLSSNGSNGLGEALAQLGIAGWEVVSKTTNDIFFLKRIIKPERPIDRPFMVGFTVHSIDHSEPVQSAVKPKEENEVEVINRAARMGISLGEEHA